MSQTKEHSSFLRNLYFWSGIIATLAYRIIIVLNFYNNLWVKISWYIGTVGFIIYFIHRYQISDKRAKLIKDNRLREKIEQASQINAEDTQALDYILRTLVTTKEKWNYIFIFVMSGLALVIGIVLDFIVK
ncbi:MAG: hypothetical protein ABIB97_04385 [Patescibacteria group bacterium]